MNWITPLTTKLPYHVVVGNHEAECHDPLCVLRSRVLLISLLIPPSFLISILFNTDIRSLANHYQTLQLIMQDGQCLLKKVMELKICGIGKISFPLEIL